MSYLPPDEAGYFEAVQVYFTEVTDRLALFGARDRALLERWKEEGRPARVVCRGIREAVASGDEGDVPRSLARCERFVDEQWERVREREVGTHGADEPDDVTVSEHDDGVDASGDEGDEPGGLFAQVRAAIEEAGRGVDEERWRRAYRRAWRRMDELVEERGEFAFDELETLEKALVDAYLDVLEDAEREALEESVASASAGLLGGMSPAAQRQHLQVKKKQILVERFGLLDLFEAI